MREYVDVIVPRGGKGLISRLLAEARVPMIQHLDGNCHVYLEEEADPNKALKIVENAKTQRYGTCNTAESLLVDRSVAAMLLPPIAHMLTAKGVEIRGCAETCALVKEAVPASDEDYYTEFLAPIISVKVVADIPDLEDTRLVIAHPQGSQSDKGYYLIVPQRKVESATLQAFRDWLVSAASAYRAANPPV